MSTRLRLISVMRFLLISPSSVIGLCMTLSMVYRWSTTRGSATSLDTRCECLRHDNDLLHRLGVVRYGCGCIRWLSLLPRWLLAVPRNVGEACVGVFDTRYSAPVVMMVDGVSSCKGARCHGCEESSPFGEPLLGEQEFLYQHLSAVCANCF